MKNVGCVTRSMGLVLLGDVPRLNAVLDRLMGNAALRVQFAARR